MLTSPVEEYKMIDKINFTTHDEEYYDVVVWFKSGEVYYGSILNTKAVLKRVFNKYESQHKYMYAPNSVITESVTNQSIKPMLEEMIDNGDFFQIFKKHN